MLKLLSNWMNNMKLLKVCLIILFSLVAIACVENKYTRMTKGELQEKQRHCNSIPNKSAVFANGCKRIRQEIERRKKLKD